MSEFPDEQFEDQPEDTQLVRDLRKQLREASKTIKEQAAKIEASAARDRAATVADILKGKGVNPKAANLIPSDLEASEEAISGWLAEYGEVLNIAPAGDGGGGEGEAEQEGKGASGVNSETVEAMRRAQATEQAGQPAGVVLGVDELNKAMAETDDMTFDQAIQFLADKGLSQPGLRN